MNSQKFETYLIDQIARKIKPLWAIGGSFVFVIGALISVIEYIQEIEWAKYFMVESHVNAVVIALIFYSAIISLYSWLYHGWLKRIYKGEFSRIKQEHESLGAEHESLTSEKEKLEAEHEKLKSLLVAVEPYIDEIKKREDDPLHDRYSVNRFVHFKGITWKIRYNKDSTSHVTFSIVAPCCKTHGTELIESTSKKANTIYTCSMEGCGESIKESTIDNMFDSLMSIIQKGIDEGNYGGKTPDTAVELD
ncbi:MAG: hypothetical protein KZQ78_03105 [Candidatus Thiodiazotropha sp. (ex Ustalcina ferruginea)]|nr:hypothetical protein [Candidatus Thiodiazotropha sp. (ex Ustalcina ferruginea)]